MKTLSPWKPVLCGVLIAAVATPLLAGPLAMLALVVNGLQLPVQAEGVLTQGSDRIGFSGQMSIKPRIIEDNDFRTPPVLELIIDFSNVKAVGVPSGHRFVTEAQTIVRRPLLAFEQVEATFPYSPADNVLAARTAKASIAVTFSASSGIRLTSKISSLQ